MKTGINKVILASEGLRRFPRRGKISRTGISKPGRTSPPLSVSSRFERGGAGARVDIDNLHIGINDPYESGARCKQLSNLAVRIRRFVAGRDNLNCQIGRHFNQAVWQYLRRVCATNKGDIQAADCISAIGIALQYEACFRRCYDAKPVSST